ncbi:anaerobic sulfatase maturase, partial [Candidatus Neomarinimicrobiota bacterium]
MKPQIERHQHLRTTPFHLLIKPIGPVCNLDCRYCFYLDKDRLYPETTSFKMLPEVLEEMIRQYIAAQPATLPEISFAWQGGEPTLMGVDFFRQAVTLQNQFRPQGQQIANTIQTNGVLLDDEWGEFLHEHKFLVGLSLDGPRELHDAYRVDKKGAGTFERVMQGLEILKRHQVEFNILTTVHHANADHPVEVYDFLTENGAAFLQFISIVEEDGNGALTDRSVRPEQYGRFLVGILERWLVKSDVGEVFVQDFDMLLSQVAGQGSPICIHAETCGRAVAMEHNGDLYSCDHYVRADHRLGNVMDTGMAAMLDSPMQLKFGNDKRDALPPCCTECEFLAYCRGGCPKDRLSRTPDGEPGLNVLCQGYKHFYERALPVME